MAYFCAMVVDYLIIGQGISGTWLSYYLQQEGKTVLVIDNAFTWAPSRIAAGIINPVTGRRHVTVWMAETLFPFALSAYTKIGEQLNITAISSKTIIDFFPSAQMRLSFLQRTEEDNTYVRLHENENIFRENFNYDFGCGKVEPAYTAHLETIIPAWRMQLKKTNSLLEEEFDHAQLQVLPEKIIYKDITANKIIFCDGTPGHQNPWFGRLPFAPNKGEVLLAEIPGLSSAFIYKKGMMLAPLTTPGHWWIGSNYAWEFENDQPTETFRQQTELLLKNWLKIPFTITDHLAGIRPATLERRPFVGLHPHHPAIGILNGMGTKGCSLAPYFAHQFTRHLLYNEPLLPEAAIKRFNRILAV
jgi:glycine/D-amino acid oxidase-like deaminating enzyme